MLAQGQLGGKLNQHTFKLDNKNWKQWMDILKSYENVRKQREKSATLSHPQRVSIVWGVGFCIILLLHVCKSIW